MNGNEGMAGVQCGLAGLILVVLGEQFWLFVRKLLFHLQDLWLSNSLLFPSLFIYLPLSLTVLISFPFSVCQQGWIYGSFVEDILQ